MAGAADKRHTQACRDGLIRAAVVTDAEQDHLTRLFVNCWHHLDHLDAGTRSLAMLSGRDDKHGLLKGIVHGEGGVDDNVV